MHVLAIELFGTSDIGVRLFDVLAQMVFAFLFYRLMRRWLETRIATIAAVLYLAYYVSSGNSMYFQRDVYLMMAVIVAILLIVDEGLERLGYLKVLLAGLLGGYSILTRPTSLLFIVILALFLCWSSISQFRFSNAVVRTAGFLLAAIFPIAAIIAYYATIPGSLRMIYDATIRFNLDIYASYRLPYFLFWREIGVKAFIVLFSIIGVFAVCRRRGSAGLHRSFTREEAWLYWALLASALFIVVYQQKFFRYHFAPFFMLLCPLAALGIYFIAANIRFRSARIVFVALTIYLCSFLTYHQPYVQEFFKAVLHGRNGLVAAYDVHHNDPTWGGARERQVLAYLDRPENSQSTVEVISFDAALRSHLRQKSASPFVVQASIAIGKDLGRGSVHEFTDYQTEWRSAYMDSLRAARPHFIILGRNTIFLLIRDPYTSFLHDLPGFDSLLRSSYRYDTAFGAYQIFRRIR
jgi:hypothetical protein